MAEVILTIRDADLNNIAIDIDLRPQFPDSMLLHTNAQLVAREVLGFLQNIAKGINDKAHIDALNGAIELNN